MVDGVVLARDFLALEARTQELDVLRWQSIEGVRCRKTAEEVQRASSVGALEKRLVCTQRDINRTSERNQIICEQASLYRRQAAAQVNVPGGAFLCESVVVERIRDARDSFAGQVERMTGQYYQAVESQLRQEIQNTQTDATVCQLRQHEMLQAACRQEQLLQELLMERRHMHEERSKLTTLDREVSMRNQSLRERLDAERQVMDCRLAEPLLSAAQPVSVPEQAFHEPSGAEHTSGFSSGNLSQTAAKTASPPMHYPSLAVPPAPARGQYCPPQGSRQFEVYQRLTSYELEMQSDLRLLDSAPPPSPWQPALPRTVDSLPSGAFDPGTRIPLIITSPAQQCTGVEHRLGARSANRCSHGMTRLDAGVVQTGMLEQHLKQGVPLAPRIAGNLDVRLGYASPCGASESATTLAVTPSNQPYHEGRHDFAAGVEDTATSALALAASRPSRCPSLSGARRAPPTENDPQPIDPSLAELMSYAQAPRLGFDNVLPSEVLPCVEASSAPISFHEEACGFACTATPLPSTLPVAQPCPIMRDSTINSSAAAIAAALNATALALGSIDGVHPDIKEVPSLHRGAATSFVASFDGRSRLGTAAGMLNHDGLQYNNPEVLRSAPPFLDVATVIEPLEVLRSSAVSTSLASGVASSSVLLDSLSSPMLPVESGRASVSFWETPNTFDLAAVNPSLIDQVERSGYRMPAQHECQNDEGSRTIGASGGNRLSNSDAYGDEDLSGWTADSLLQSRLLSGVQSVSNEGPRTTYDIARLGVGIAVAAVRQEATGTHTDPTETIECSATQGSDSFSISASNIGDNSPSRHQSSSATSDRGACPHGVEGVEQSPLQNSRQSLEETPGPTLSALGETPGMLSVLGEAASPMLSDISESPGEVSGPTLSALGTTPCRIPELGGSPSAASQSMQGEIAGHASLGDSHVFPSALEKTSGLQSTLSERLCPDSKLDEAAVFSDNTPHVTFVSKPDEVSQLLSGDSIEPPTMLAFCAESLGSDSVNAALAPLGAGQAHAVELPVGEEAGGGSDRAAGSAEAVFMLGSGDTGEVCPTGGFTCKGDVIAECGAPPLETEDGTDFQTPECSEERGPMSSAVAGFVPALEICPPDKSKAEIKDAELNSMLDGVTVGKRQTEMLLPEQTRTFSGNGAGDAAAAKVASDDVADSSGDTAALFAKGGPFGSNLKLEEGDVAPRPDTDDPGSLAASVKGGNDDVSVYEGDSEALSSQVGPLGFASQPAGSAMVREELPWRAGDEKVNSGQAMASEASEGDVGDSSGDVEAHFGQGTPLRRKPLPRSSTLPSKAIGIGAETVQELSRSLGLEMSGETDDMLAASLDIPSDEGSGSFGSGKSPAKQGNPLGRVAGSSALRLGNLGEAQNGVFSKQPSTALDSLGSGSGSRQVGNEGAAKAKPKVQSASWSGSSELLGLSRESRSSPISSLLPRAGKGSRPGGASALGGAIDWSQASTKW